MAEGLQRDAADCLSLNDSMIQYLAHFDIDKHRWDQCIAQSVNRRVYAFSWYLDMVSPGWDALVETDYNSVFPLTHHRKGGIRYLYQPFFTQQLGIFSRQHLTASLVDQFIKAIPSKFKYADIHLNVMNKVNADEYDCHTRMNHELDLIPGYETLIRNYSQNTRRNIRKAIDQGIHLGRKAEADELITLFKEGFGKKEGILKFSHYEILRKLILHCQKNSFGVILGAYAPEECLSAAAFFLYDCDRMYYLFAASGKDARENGAMFLLLDHAIKEHAGKALTLDFEGGNDPNLGRFYKSFGAMEVPYPFLHINRLPGLVGKGVKFIRKIRT